jgi:hypothetical protein
MNQVHSIKSQKGKDVKSNRWEQYVGAARAQQNQVGLSPSAITAEFLYFSVLAYK